jgi:hypothetical protein
VTIGAVWNYENAALLDRIRRCFARYKPARRPEALMLG